MPKYVKYQKPGMGIDIPRTPWRMGNFNEISFDGGKTWVSPSPYLVDQRYVGLFRGAFSVRKKAATSAQHWIGFSPSFPTQSGHTYICTFEVRNVLSAISYGRLITSKSASDTSFDITSYPLTANQTEYTRVWHTFVQSSEGTGRAYIDACPAVAGTDIQLDIRDLRYIDVTGIDSSKYTSIGNQDWYAIRTSLAAINMRTGHGLTRTGNVLSLDVASVDEIAEGASCKAVTADKLQSYLNNSNNYPAQPENLAKNPDPYSTTWATWKQTSPSQHPFGSMVIFEHISQTANAAWHLDSGSTTMASWINGISGKYIVSMDVFDTSEGTSTINLATYSNGTTSTITGCSRNTNYVKNKWIHLAILVTATTTFQLNIEIGHDGVEGKRKSFRMKNFKIYRVTDINANLYPAIGKGQTAFIQVTEPVYLSSNSVNYRKASVSDLIDGSTHKDYVVDNDSLSRAIMFGRARDVTCGALGFGRWKEISFDGGTSWQTITLNLLYSLQYDRKWRNGFSLRDSSSDTGQHWFGYSEPGGGKRFPTEPGHRYLFIVDARNSGAAITSGQVQRYSGESSPITNGTALPHTASQTAYTRLYSTFIYNSNASYDGRAWLDIYPAAANQVTRVDVSGWWHFDVTGMSTSDIVYLATLPSSKLNDIYFRYLIKEDAICPIKQIIDAGSASTLVIQPGRAYRLIASGTHTITTGEYIQDAVGEETHVEIITNGASVLQVNQPILLMDKIKLNAINNCTIIYINGKIKMYVDDVHQGYVVSVVSGQGENSLYYGLTKNLEGSLEYISFGGATDNKQIEVTGSAPTIFKPVSIIGNGREKTDVTFNGGITGTEQAFTASYITIRDFTWNGGTLNLSSAGLSGTVNITGGSINFNGVNSINGTITTDVGMNLQNNCTLYGNGSSIIGRNTYIYNRAKSGVTLNNITIRNVCFENSILNLYGARLYRETAHGVALGALLIRSNLTIVNCYLDGGGGTVIHSDSNYASISGTTFTNGTSFVGGSPSTIENCTFTNTAYFGYIGYGQKKTLINNRNLPNISSYSGSGNVITGVLVFDQYNGLIGKFTPTIAGCTVCITPNSTLDLRGNANAAAISGVVLKVGTISGNNITVTGSAKIINTSGTTYTISGSGTYINSNGTTDLTRS